MRVTDEMVMAALDAEQNYPPHHVEGIGPVVSANAAMRAALEAALAVEGTEAKAKPVARPTFPILGGGGARIDYQLVADHGKQAQTNHHQSVATLAGRGGLSWSELYAVLHDRAWRDMNANEAMLACRALEARYLAAVTTPPAGIREALEVIESFIAETVDYATRNNLGDPEKQHNVKWGRKVLAALRGQS